MENSVSRNGLVFAGVTFKEDPGTVKVYEFVYTQNADQTSSNMPNKGLGIDIKLIHSKQYPKMNAFMGLSSNGNEIYFNINTHFLPRGNITRMRRCVDGTFFRNGQCFNCSASCKTCFLAETFCTSCHNPTLYKSYDCIDCNKFFGCQLCTNETCTKCNDSIFFDPTPQNGTCVCQPRYYLDSNSNCSLCALAIMGCNTCFNDSVCKSCQPLFHWKLDTNGKCKCIDNYVLNGSSCVLSCAVITGCIKCTSVDHCIQCNASANF